MYDGPKGEYHGILNSIFLKILKMSDYENYLKLPRVKKVLKSEMILIS